MVDSKSIPADQNSVDERDVKVAPLTAEEFVAAFPEERRKKTVRKVDVRLVPLLLLLYLVAYLDRANIGNAKIEGLEADLNMKGTDYNVATSVFFVPYCMFEVPSNYVLKRYFSRRPSLWIGSLCLAWGVVMTLTGVVQNFAGLCVARVMLGLTESGFFPGAILLCSYWYLKDELQTRISIFYLASSLSGAFSGLLAYAIAKMDGIAGVEGWRWIFILEGIASVVMAVITLICLPDSPETSGRWLDDDEMRYLRDRMIVQDGGSDVKKHQAFSWSLMKQVVLDWKLYVSIIIFWAVAGPTYGLKFTLPEIITTMGFSSSEAQLLSMPPYILGGIAGVFCSWLSDKFTWRAPFIAGPLILEVIGFAILCGFGARIMNNIALCYVAVCIANIGIYPLNPGISAWTSNNLAGPEKRSLGIGFYLTWGNVAGIVGSYIYKNSEKPDYPTGYGTSLGLASLAFILTFVLEFGLWRLNKKKESKTEEEWREIYTDEQLADLGDASPLYKYTY